jgi:hypothetical protein
MMIDELKQALEESELEKQEMKIIVDETLSKYSNQESTVFESEQKRIALQNEYQRVSCLTFMCLEFR